MGTLAFPSLAAPTPLQEKNKNEGYSICRVRNPINQLSQIDPPTIVGCSL